MMEKEREGGRSAFILTEPKKISLLHGSNSPPFDLAFRILLTF